MAKVKEDQLEEQGVLNVKRLVVFSAAAAAAFLIAGMIFSDASAQSRGPATSAANIGLVDVQYIFKQLPRFKQQMEEMRKDVEAAEANVKQRTQQIKQKAQDLQRLPKGSPEYKRLEQEITEDQTTVTIEVKKQRREFLEREAKIYHNTYREILQAIGYVAQHNGIGVVLRFSREQANPDNPEEVLRDINKPIVWQRSGLDITDLVLQDLVRDSGPRVGTGSSRPHSPYRRN